jgi:mRNA-degrading endonuclease toxin of MazEF toxin-antitoxin module
VGQPSRTDRSATGAAADADPGLRVPREGVVAEIITTVRGIPQEVPLGRRGGLGRPSVGNFDNIHVIPLERVGELIGVLASARHTEVKRAVGYAFDWPELKVL